MDGFFLWQLFSHSQSFSVQLVRKVFVCASKMSLDVSVSLKMAAFLLPLLPKQPMHQRQPQLKVVLALFSCIVKDLLSIIHTCWGLAPRVVVSWHPMCLDHLQSGIAQMVLLPFRSVEPKNLSTQFALTSLANQCLLRRKQQCHACGLPHLEDVPRGMNEPCQ